MGGGGGHAAPCGRVVDGEGSKQLFLKFLTTMPFWKFKRMQIWARVINLPYNLSYPPWREKVASMMGGIVKMDVDSKGFAFGESLGARIWIKFNEPLMRWVQLESACMKEIFSRENFVFATLAFANFSYATLEFDISFLPLLSFDNTSQMPFHGKNDNFSFHFCHS